MISHYYLIIEIAIIRKPKSAARRRLLYLISVICCMSEKLSECLKGYKQKLQFNLQIEILCLLFQLVVSLFGSWLLILVTKKIGASKSTDIQQGVHVLLLTSSRRNEKKLGQRDDRSGSRNPNPHLKSTVISWGSRDNIIEVQILINYGTELITALTK